MDAAIAAAADAGLTARRRSTPSASSARSRGATATPLGHRPTSRPVAAELVHDRRRQHPPAAVNETALDLLAGRLDVAVLTGGEAWRTRMRARKRGAILDWAKAPDDVPPVMLGGELDMTHPAEAERGVYLPVQIYPMFETAIRAAAGRDPDDHLVARQRAVGRVLSDVAADEPVRVDPRRQVARGDPHDLGRRTASSALPYRKYMNSNNDVDMAAASSCARSRRRERLGVARDRWVFPHAGTDCHEHPYVSQPRHVRPHARRSSSAASGRSTSPGSASTTSRIVDLYSCFPSAVQLGAQSLGLRPRPPAHAHGRPAVRRRPLEQLRDARHRHRCQRSA